MEKMVVKVRVERFHNAISIVNLETLEHTEAMAGAFPKDVQFNGDSSLGVVISDDYLSTIDFTQTPPTLVRIPIADDLVNPPLAEEVLLDPEGRYAIVRQYGVDQLVLVDLQTSGDPISMLDVGVQTQRIWMCLQMVRRRWWWHALQKSCGFMICKTLRWHLKFWHFQKKMCLEDCS